MSMEPAKSVIEKMGGIDAVASITGRHVTRVYRWTYPRAKGGTDGRIPQIEAEKLLQHARSNGIDLHPSDFFSSATPDTAVA